MSNVTEYHGVEIYAKMAASEMSEIIASTVMMIDGMDVIDEVTMVVTDEGKAEQVVSFIHLSWQIRITHAPL